MNKWLFATPLSICFRAHRYEGRACWEGELALSTEKWEVRDLERVRNS